MSTTTAKAPPAVAATEVVVYRAGVGETHGGSRCHFGEPHVWQFGITSPDNTDCVDDLVVCLRCGREESDTP